MGFLRSGPRQPPDPAAFMQIAQALAADVSELLKRCGDVGLLLLKLLDECGRARGQKAGLLRAPFAAVAVKIEVLLDFGEREANRFGPKDQLEARALPPRINAAAIHAGRSEKLFRLVKADRARRDVKFAR